MSELASDRACMDTVTEIEYGRFQDLERRFGIKRSTAYKLIWLGKIKSVCAKRKGARSGIRLIDMQSVRDFLRQQPSH